MAKQRHGKVRVYLPGMVNEKGEQIYRNIPADMWQNEHNPFQKQGYKLATDPAPAPVEAKPTRTKKAAPFVTETKNAENEEA